MPTLKFLEPLGGRFLVDAPVTLTLIRHGQTTANVAHALDTALPGAPLTPHGEEQARELRPFVGEQLTFSSEALRARQTATLAASNYQGAWPGLKEIAAGELEMRNDSAAITAFATGWYEMTRNPETGRIPGGETAQEFLQRYLTALGELLTSHGSIAVVTHGSAMALCGILATGKTYEEADKIDNCHTIVMRVPAGDIIESFGQWTLESWGTHQVGLG